MTRDDPAAEKLLTFCSRLPAFPDEPEKAEAGTRHAQACFAQRREEIEATLLAGADPRQDPAALRCEAKALEAAQSILTQLWQRRFGTALSGV
jgi:hypothetical protein